MTDEQRAFWFYAKRFGWGWGMPATWQGWLVLIIYVLLLVGGRWVVPMSEYFLPYIVLITILLIGIVVATGERPLRWRWGKE